MNQRLPIEGTHNFRDIGGYPAAGGRTRPGQLYRSDALSGLTDPGRGALAGLGIGVAIDLRSELEVSQDHSTEPLPGAIRVRVPIHGGSRRSIIEGDHISIEKLYAGVLEDSAWSLAAAVSVIADSGASPVLVSCTAGKDRTGLVVALALEAVGVDRAAVVADYMRSALNLDGEWMEQAVTVMVSNGVPVSPALLEVLGGAPDGAMTRVLAGLDQQYGSVTGYLLAHGVLPESLPALRAKLVG